MSQPPPAAVQWASATLGRDVASADPLPGAWSSAVFRLESPPAPPVVLRLFTDAAWLAAEPDLAEHEAAVLETVAGSGLPVPRLIAFDPDGSAAGLPAVLMSHLPGSVDLSDDAVESLAEPLLHLAGFDPGAFPWTYRRWTDPAAVPVPGWIDDAAGVATAFRSVTDLPDARPVRLIHRDYHPTNVLRRGRAVSGIVDWVNGCLGPPQIDVAHCRLNLALVNGEGAADRFVREWERLGEAAYDTRWDIVAAADLVTDLEVYPPWRALGHPHLHLSDVRRRLERFVLTAT